MFAYYINLILFFISLFTLLYFTYKPKKNFKFLFKTITSILFISTGVISYIICPKDYYYFILLITGLFFSLFGDMFLALKINSNGYFNNYFIYGLISFLLTHIMYILAFSHLGFFSIFDLIVALILSLLIITTLKSNKNIDFKNMFVPASIYSFIICLMTLQSIKLVFLYNFSISTYLLLAGTLLFTLSDLILSFILFDTNHKKYLAGINLFTYYTGQFLIASTLLFF